MLKSLEKGLKHALSAVIRWLLPEELPPSSMPGKTELGKVLVIRHDNKIGNLLLITPLLHSLRRTLPVARISLLVSEAYPEILENNTDIDSLIIFHKKRLLRFPWKAVGLLRRLRGGRFDLAIDASHPHSFSLTSALIAKLTGAPWRLGFERGDSTHYLNLRAGMPTARMHESDVFLSLLEHIGLEPHPGPLRYSVKDSESTWAQKELRRLGCVGDEPLIGIFTGGRGRKRITLETCIEIARLIEERGLGLPAFFLGPLERDQRNSLEKATDRSWIVSPHYPVRKFAALLSRLSVLVTPDTGPMHLANALGVHIVAIFREESAWRYGPRGEHDCTLICQNDIDCDLVGEAVSRTLRMTSSTVSENSSSGSKPQDH